MHRVRRLAATVGLLGGLTGATSMLAAPASADDGVDAYSTRCDTLHICVGGPVVINPWFMHNSMPIARI